MTVDVHDTLAYFQFEAVRAYLESRGHDGAAFARRVGAPVTPPEDPDARISIAVMRAAWVEAYRLEHDPALALRLGARQSTSRLGVIGLVIHQAETVNEALRQVCRYFLLISGGVRLAVDTSKEGELALVMTPVHTPSSIWPVVVERGFAFTAAGIARLSEERVRPLRAELSCPAPAHAAAYREFLAPDCRFGAGRDALVFSAEAAATPLPGRQARLHAMLDEEASHRLRILRGEETLSSRLRLVLPDLVARALATAGECARRLGVSERTLHRRLADEKLSFRDLLDEVRRERCLHLMDEGGLAIEGIAFALGYQEPSGFFRAFRRWTGQTPSAYRATHRGGKALGTSCPG